ncbi:MAG: glycosyltransferase family 2 protein, partial [Methylophagaceae bacterium]
MARQNPSYYLNVILLLSYVIFQKSGPNLMKAVDVNLKVIRPGTGDVLPSEKEYLPRVAVLLCTHHGEAFLAEQLDSIFSQTHKNIVVWASDDGSTDGTHKLLEYYQSLLGREKLSIHAGPKEGFVLNFLSLICHSDIEADYYAFADQDDIWESDKLCRAIEKLENVPLHQPALYCSRTRLINDNGAEIGFSPLFKEPPSFANSLVQNIGGGNTMVMNKKAINLLRSVGEFTVVSHDWWAYILVSGSGGKLFYDSCPTVRYRQHANNLVGSNRSWSSRLFRAEMLMRGRFRDWNSINIEALRQANDFLTPENKRILSQFSAAREAWLLPRLRGIFKSGVYRQTLIGNIGLF